MPHRQFPLVDPDADLWIGLEVRFEIQLEVMTRHLEGARMPGVRRALITASTTAMLASLACAAPRGFVCPAHGGPTWREVSSEHVVLRTDLDSDSARSVVREIEYTRALLLSAMFGRSSIDTVERIEVVAFATRAELAEFTDTRHDAFFYRDAFGRQGIVLAGGIEDEQGMTIAHEMAHMLSAHFVVRQPRWFAEGVAQYFQTLGKPSFGRARSAGAPPGDGYSERLRRAPVDVRDVLLWVSAEDEEELYAASWLLVHFLMSRQPDQFEAFQRRLVRASDPGDAWNDTFPEWSIRREGATKALDRALRGYLDDGRATARLQVAGSVEGVLKVRTDERALAPAQVHTLRLELPRAWPDHALRAEVEEALREDSAHVGALARAATRDPSAAPALARRAVAAHPEDPRAWTFLAHSLAPGEREMALRRSVELAPDRAEYIADLAAELDTSKRYAEAVTMSRRAIQLAPWSPVSLTVHARALAHLGRCQEASATMKRAAEVFREGISPGAIAALSDWAASLEGECHSREERSPAP
ncbi:MAG TPA: hypothetical protein VFP65_11580 [Anaeromyxobacteraceae bacterium]|nr:hypothetical protein [Anaeromyxobacteraceae bacterium]